MVQLLSELEYLAPAPQRLFERVYGSFGSFQLVEMSQGRFIFGLAIDRTIEFQLYSDGGRPIGSPVVFDAGMNVGFFSMIGLPGGGFVVGLNGSPSHFQMFDASLRPIGTPQELSGIVHNTPKLVALAEGGFAAAWVARDTNENQKIFTQVFDADGNAVSPRSVIEARADGSSAAVELVAFSDGGYAAVSSASGLKVQMVGRDGTPIGQPIAVLAATASLQAFDIASVGVDRFVVAWIERANTSYVLRVQVLNSDGSTLPPFQINAAVTEFGLYDIIGLADGQFLVTWIVPDGNIRAQRFATSGASIGEVFFVNGVNPITNVRYEVAAFGNGDLAFAYGGRDPSLTVTSIDLRLAFDYVTSTNASGTSLPDAILAGNAASVLGGGAADDTLVGLAGSDQLYGDDGDDLLIGGAGGDLLVGGRGRDVVSYADDSGGVIISLGDGTARQIDGSIDRLSEVEDIIGTPFDDLLSGDLGDNRLRGGAGADRITYTGGNDVLLGEAGDDLFRIVAAAATTDTTVRIDGGIGTNQIEFSNDEPLIIDARLNLSDGRSIFTARTSSRSYTIEGIYEWRLSAGADVAHLAGFTNGFFAQTPYIKVYAGAGNDLIEVNATGGVYGEAGDDTVVAGSYLGAYFPTPVLDGGDGIDTLIIFSPAYVNLSTGVVENYGYRNYSVSSFEVVEVRTGSTLIGTITGSPGADVIRRVDGEGGEMSRLIFEGLGGDDTLYGGTGTSYLYGGDGNDRIVGGSGRDSGQGGAGDDIISGGGGNDVFGGDGGSDLYVMLGLDEGNDRIVDFAFDEDLFDLGGRQFTGSSDQGGATRLTYSGGTVELSGVTGRSLAQWNERVLLSGGGRSFIGDSGSGSLAGTSQSDRFDLSQGGNDRVLAGAGDDGIFFGAAFTTADFVDGGAGANDQLALQGDYAAGLTLGAAQLVNTEVVVMLPGFGYSLTTLDDLVPAGGAITVYTATLAAGDVFALDARGERDAGYRVIGGAGADTVRLGAGDDIVSFGPGGFDPARDLIDGGAGRDRLVLDGSYTLTLAGDRVIDVETVELAAGIAEARNVFAITLADSFAPDGTMRTVDGSAVVTALTVDGGAEASAPLTLIGGGAADVLTGGGGADVLRGGLGGDRLTGGAGADVFGYAGAAESTGIGFDRIDLDPAADRIDLPGAVTFVDPVRRGGTLTQANFTGDMAALAAPLAADGAMLVTGARGDFAGRVFLVVDGNGVAGYQDGADYLFEIPAAVQQVPLGIFI